MIAEDTMRSTQIQMAMQRHPSSRRTRHAAVRWPVTETLDLRGLSCPLPIVRTARTLEGLPSGTVVAVLATDPGSKEDFIAWCTSTGHALLEAVREGRVYRYVIRKR
jgi:tRNA 2-thiouridine synthesizing protein A